MTLLTGACPFYELLYTVVIVIVGRPVTQTGQKIHFRHDVKVPYRRFVCIRRNNKDTVRQNTTLYCTTFKIATCFGCIRQLSLILFFTLYEGIKDCDHKILKRMRGIKAIIEINDIGTRWSR